MKKTVATRPARRIEPSFALKPAATASAPTLEPAPIPAPAAPRPVRQLAKPLAPVAQSAPPTAMTPALKARLQDAVAVLAGKAGRRIDGHDKSQARKLLAAHPDKLSQVTGASQVLEVEDEADTLD